MTAAPPTIPVSHGLPRIRDLRCSRRLEVMNPDKSGNSPAGIGHKRRRGHSDCAVHWSLSPHPSPLLWGEGEPFSPRSAIQTFGLSPRGARCSLSLRERVRVKGNGANHRLAYRTVPGTVELDESSSEARGFAKRQ